MVLRLARLCSLVACLAATTAWADGKRDLEDGIAFYENLDTERALARLEAAAIAKDLDGPNRARAYLYLGMLQLEIGNKEKAEKAWRRAFKLDLGISAPKGTSPKTIEALESARARFRPDEPPEPGGPKDAGVGAAGAADAARRTPSPQPDAGAGPPDASPPDASPLLATGPGPAEPDSGGSLWWLWVGLGAAVVAGGVAGAYFLTRSECEGGGGCFVVELSE